MLKVLLMPLAIAIVPDCRDEASTLSIKFVGLEIPAYGDPALFAKNCLVAGQAVKHDAMLSIGESVVTFGIKLGEFSILSCVTTGEKIYRGSNPLRVVKKEFFTVRIFGNKPLTYGLKPQGRAQANIFDFVGDIWLLPGGEVRYFNVSNRDVCAYLDLSHLAGYFDSTFSSSSGFSSFFKRGTNQPNSPDAYTSSENAEQRHQPLSKTVFPRIELANGGYNPRDIVFLGLLFLFGVLRRVLLNGWLTKPNNDDDGK